MDTFTGSCLLCLRNLMLDQIWLSQHNMHAFCFRAWTCITIWVLFFDPKSHLSHQTDPESRLNLSAQQHFSVQCHSDHVTAFGLGTSGAPRQGLTRCYKHVAAASRHVSVSLLVISRCGDSDSDHCYHSAESAFQLMAGQVVCTSTFACLQLCVVSILTNSMYECKYLCV